MKPPLPDRQVPATLLDKKADLGTRDDIAMDLGAYDDPEVENVLRQIVCDVTEDEMTVDSAGESLREIWKRNGKRGRVDFSEGPGSQEIFRQLNGIPVVSTNGT